MTNHFSNRNPLHSIAAINSEIVCIHKNCYAAIVTVWWTWNEYRGNLGFKVKFHIHFLYLKCCILSRYTQHLGERDSEVQCCEFSAKKQNHKVFTCCLNTTIWCNSNQLLNAHIKLCWPFHTPGHIPVHPFLLLHSLQTSKEKYFVLKGRHGSKNGVCV